MSIINGNTPKALLKEIAELNGVRLQDLLVLSSQNDPFNCGGPAQIRQAEWFARVWSKFMGDQKGHLRKLHYKLVSQSEAQFKPDGKPYRNTEADWDKLQLWSKSARYLGLIDARQVVDHRNPHPHIFAPDPVGPSSPSWSVADWYGFQLPTIRTDLWADFELPEVHVEGYEYRSGEQPYLLEVWVEKSTMDDELIPICKELGVNLVTSTGYQSVTGAISTFSRAGAYAAQGRPVRIFYLSDFDPAGDSMPFAVARQLEFWFEQFGAGIDLKLTPLALTKAQVLKYQLPETPLKQSDKRRDGFQARHGVDGGVELDALEAIHPGELGRLIEAAIREYRDDDLELDLTDLALEADDAVAEAWEEHMEPFKSRAAHLNQQANVVIKQFQPRLKQLSEEFKEAIAPILESTQELQSEVEDLVDSVDLDIDLPERPIASVIPPDESEWLYSSDRDFDEQLEHYRDHRGGR